MPEFKEICRQVYDQTYQAEKERLLHDAGQTEETALRESCRNKIETAAQKEAIKCATIYAMRQFPGEAPADIWKAVYEVHVHRKSGIDDAAIISGVISADQSWKKSSGHAFEEMIKFLANAALENTGVEIVLQRDLSVMIKDGQLANEPRDISWLKEQVKASVFDLYAVVIRADGRKLCFGCIQSKTSVRDRVTRDREPSLQAMASYFWSTIIVLDGDFLHLPKFTAMVNGGTREYPNNGWHGMYVFSDEPAKGRIYSTDLNFERFKNHALYAAQYWMTQRQWFDSSWIVEE